MKDVIIFENLTDELTHKIAAMGIAFKHIVNKYEKAIMDPSLYYTENVFLNEYGELVNLYSMAQLFIDLFQKTNPSVLGSKEIETLEALLNAIPYYREKIRNMLSSRSFWVRGTPRFLAINNPSLSENERVYLLYGILPNNEEAFQLVYKREDHPYIKISDSINFNKTKDWKDLKNNERMEILSHMKLNKVK